MSKIYSKELYPENISKRLIFELNRYESYSYLGASLSNYYHLKDLSDAVDKFISLHDDVFLETKYQTYVNTIFSIVIKSNLIYRDIITILLDRGAEVNKNIKSYIITTPLIESIQNNNIEFAILLIDKGADINYQHLYGA